MSKYFTYASKRDKAMMVVGSIAAVFAGFLVSAFAIVMGEVTNTFNPMNASENITDKMKKQSLYITLVGLGVWIFSYVYYALWQHLAENISFDLRKRYLNTLLK